MYGIKDSELERFNDYLFARKIVVAFNSCLSKKQDLSTGVPQGSILGPLMFLIASNDAVEVMEHQAF